MGGSSHFLFLKPTDSPAVLRAWPGSSAWLRGLPVARRLPPHHPLPATQTCGQDQPRLFALTTALPPRLVHTAPSAPVPSPFTPPGFPTARRLCRSPRRDVLLAQGCGAASRPQGRVCECAASMPCRARRHLVHALSAGRRSAHGGVSGSPRAGQARPRLARRLGRARREQSLPQPWLTRGQGSLVFELALFTAWKAKAFRLSWGWFHPTHELLH